MKRSWFSLHQPDCRREFCVVQGFRFCFVFLTFPLAPPRTEHAVGKVCHVMAQGGKWSITDEGESYNRKMYSYRLHHEQCFCCPPDGPAWQQTNSTEPQTAASPLDPLHNPDDLAVSPTWPAAIRTGFWLWYWTNCGATRCYTSLCLLSLHPEKNKPLGSLELFLELFTRQWLT